MVAREFGESAAAYAEIGEQTSPGFGVQGVETSHDLMNEETSSSEKYGCNAARVDIDREDKEFEAVPPQLMNWKAALLGN